ncbi:choice-of-anchor H family protein [Rheinheimera sp. MMS21-TC3]|uniref:choice-of-anchor H family protein n=1 Tax=Rheinheimera sp. MMS21-TC3 TaxID=3072790 RepID=UPI0028C3CAE0|nr:choice-of-anchor H family protein [Rheinheimera sp. MMS21-TC3]WNO62132.1 choice-of-anchor H family protein [Rheinheimera sp. MMS21-TC3]
MKTILQSIILFMVLSIPAYSEEPANSMTIERQGKPDISNLAKTQLNQRSAGNSSQAYESYVWFHSVDLHLSGDINENGYYHRLEIEIDADTSDPYVQVFAEYSLTSRYGKEYIFHTSSVFELFNQRNDDWFATDTVLHRDYPRDEYLLTIRLFNAKTGYLVAEISGYDDHSLDLLPLEDYQRDIHFDHNTSVGVAVAAGNTSSIILLGLVLLFMYRKSKLA